MKYTNEFLEIDGLGYSIEVELDLDEVEIELSTLVINSVCDLEKDGSQPEIEPTDYHYTKVEEFLVNEGAFNLAS